MYGKKYDLIVHYYCCITKIYVITIIVIKNSFASPEQNIKQKIKDKLFIRRKCDLDILIRKLDNVSNLKKKKTI